MFNKKFTNNSFWIVIAIGFLIIYSLMNTDSNDNSQVLSSSGDTLVYEVTEVVDGDTIKVEFSNQEERTIRLLGIDAPESSKSPSGEECYGAESTKFLEELLADEQIYFRFDGSQDLKDRYERYLNYIWIDDGDGDESNDLFVNKTLVEEGYAFEYTYDKPYYYQSEFIDAQEIAQKDLIGMWAADTCNYLQESK